MSDLDALDRRLRAVERALTDTDDDLTDLRDAAELTRELESLATRLDDAEDRLDRLDAATQALRGYVGNVRAVNQSVERTANAALATAESAASDDPESATRTAADRWGSPVRSDEPTCQCVSRRSDESSASRDRPDTERLPTRLADSLARLLTRTPADSRAEDR